MSENIDRTSNKQLRLSDERLGLILTYWTSWKGSPGSYQDDTRLAIKELERLRKLVFDLRRPHGSCKTRACTRCDAERELGSPVETPELHPTSEADKLLDAAEITIRLCKGSCSKDIQRRIKGYLNAKFPGHIVSSPEEPTREYLKLAGWYERNHGEFLDVLRKPHRPGRNYIPLYMASAVEPSRNQAEATSSGAVSVAPVPRGSLPNSLGTGGAGSHPAASSSEKAKTHPWTDDRGAPTWPGYAGKASEQACQRHNTKGCTHPLCTGMDESFPENGNGDL
jgi:hypothetical protein